MSALTTPAEWRGRRVYTLDILLFVREKIAEGVMPELFLGAVDVRAMVAFVQGLELSLYYNGYPDEEYQAFITWLRDVKQEFPASGGWAKKYLADCDGDHLAAIKKYLDFVAEFRALKPAGPRELRGDAPRSS